MPIVIEETDGRYSASVTPPHGAGQEWSTTKPMERDQLVVTLRELGCHQTDIGDAFYAANPDWLG